MRFQPYTGFPKLCNPVYKTLYKHWVTGILHSQAKYGCLVHTSTTHLSAAGQKSKKVKKNASKKYSDTLNLPQMPYDLSAYKSDGRCNDREQYVQEVADFAGLYDWQKQHNTGTEFIIHDGPPYANGDLHTGHALNKIIKDIINRYRVMRGHKVDFRPGWDCHGLPIETKARAANDFSLSDLEVRKLADEFSRETVHKQRSEFLQWGLMADWSNPYITSDPEFIQQELGLFQQLYDKGFVYQDYMPVYWSPSSRTALAEAELEYNDLHKSTAVYVKLKLDSIPSHLQTNIPPGYEKYAVIWTTTPWTLPANQAVCYSAEHEYILLSDAQTKQSFLIAKDLVDTFSSKLQRKLVSSKSFSGSELGGVTYKHPIYEDRKCPLLPADHVTTTVGTGLVHTAPAHGHDDFKVALKHDLNRSCMVDEMGCYTDMAGENFSGKHVFEDGNRIVLDHIEESLLHSEEYIHKYPYDWRTKQPVIIRASSQWFINTHDLIEPTMKALDKVKVFPAVYKSSLCETIKQRPYWCISRQRAWGVPIPAFYDEQGTPYVNGHITEHLRELVKKHGADIWWKAEVDALLPKEVRLKADIDPDIPLRTGGDILDIWFDSGVTWSHVLGDNRQADLYIEGVDQIRGWFQSSLLTSVALTGRAPYKSILMHGFTVDETGQKMSKSLGNVIAPSDIIYGNKQKKWPAYGVDVLRWWAANKYSITNVDIGPDITKQYNDKILLLRKRMRFILGNLYDLGAEDSLVEYEELLPQDKYYLHLLYEYGTKVTKCYEDNEISQVLHELELFATKFSNQYTTMCKDRLYCYPLDSLDRRSAQTVLHQTLEVILRSFAPILPFFAEDCYHHRHAKQLNKGQDKSVVSAFRSGWFSLQSQWHNPALAGQLEMVMSLMNEVKEKVGNTQTETLEIVFIVEEDCESYKILQDLQSDDDDGELSTHSPLCELLQCASAIITTDITSAEEITPDNYTYDIVLNTKGDEDIRVLVRTTNRLKCERCRRYTAVTVNEPCEMCLLNMSDTWAS